MVVTKESYCMCGHAEGFHVSGTGFCHGCRATLPTLKDRLQFDIEVELGSSCGDPERKRYAGLRLRSLLGGSSYEPSP
jgi:hypothetical protein